MKFLHKFDYLKTKFSPELAVKIDRWFISLFIIAYFISVIFWLWLNLPAPLKPKETLYQTISTKLTPVTSLTGVDQNWTLFSPEVRAANSYSLMLMTFQSGLLKLQELPRMEKLNILQKWRQEKFRKLFIDNFPNPQYAFIRLPVSRFLVRANYQPENPPTRLAYFLISQPVLPPGSNRKNKAEDKSNIEKIIENYFVYGVSPEDYN